MLVVVRMKEKRKLIQLSTENFNRLVDYRATVAFPVSITALANMAIGRGMMNLPGLRTTFDFTKLNKTQPTKKGK